MIGSTAPQGPDIGAIVLMWLVGGIIALAVVGFVMAVVLKVRGR